MSRFVSVQPGVTSWHSFSAGAHYDPDNVAFGPVIGMDEHLVEPGAGFDWHGHRDVFIVSRVLEGTLRHEDSSGEVRLVEPGEFLVQSTGNGVRHTETNASPTASLRFLQLTLLDSEDSPSVTQVAGAVVVGGHRVEMTDELAPRPPVYVFVVGTGRDLRLRESMPAPSTDGVLLTVRFGARDAR